MERVVEHFRVDRFVRIIHVRLDKELKPLLGLSTGNGLLFRGWIAEMQSRKE